MALGGGVYTKMLGFLIFYSFPFNSVNGKIPTPLEIPFIFPMFGTKKKYQLQLNQLKPQIHYSK